MGDELLDQRVYRVSGFNQQHDPARLLQVLYQLFNAVAPNNALAFCASLDKVVHPVAGAVVHRHAESLVGHVEHEIFAHHRQTDQTNILLCHRSRSPQTSVNPMHC